MMLGELYYCSCCSCFVVFVGSVWHLYAIQYDVEPLKNEGTYTWIQNGVIIKRFIVSMGKYKVTHSGLMEQRCIRENNNE
jgi:hypothetical protein